MSAKAIFEYEQRIICLERALREIANHLGPDSMIRDIAIHALEETE